MLGANGRDINPYRMGDRGFYGLGGLVNTSWLFTVITQFLTDNDADEGILVETKRFYLQDEIVIHNVLSNIDGVEGNSLKTGFCIAQRRACGTENSFERRGGLEATGVAMTEVMVMVISLWDDPYSDVSWLDGIYPPMANDFQRDVRENFALSNIDHVQMSQGSSAVVFPKLRVDKVGSRGFRGEICSRENGFRHAQRRITYHLRLKFEDAPS